ncbi:hypothetical protein ACMFMF_003234 [Clarireedia jacksonii]
MRFSTSLITLLAATVHADFLLPQPLSNIPTGLPDRITWTLDSISGPLSLYLVPAGSQDPDSAILTIASQIPNYGIYQWVPSDTIESTESAFSILMVDSTNSKTVSGTFYLDGLLSTPSNQDLRRRGPVDVRTQDSTTQDAQSKNIVSGGEAGNDGNGKSSSTNPELSNGNKQSVVLGAGITTCGPPVTVTRTMILGGTGGTGAANTKTRGSSNAGSTGTSSPSRNSTSSANGNGSKGFDCESFI